MKTLTTFSGSFIVSSFIRREVIYSVTCILSVSFFRIFRIIFILLSYLAMSIIMLFLASCINLLKMFQYLMYSAFNTASLLSCCVCARVVSFYVHKIFLFLV